MGICTHISRTTHLSQLTFCSLRLAIYFADAQTEACPPTIRQWIFAHTNVTNKKQCFGVSIIAVLYCVLWQRRRQWHPMWTGRGTIADMTIPCLQRRNVNVQRCCAWKYTWPYCVRHRLLGQTIWTFIRNTCTTCCPHWLVTTKPQWVNYIYLLYSLASVPKLSTDECGLLRMSRSAVGATKEVAMKTADFQIPRVRVRRLAGWLLKRTKSTRFTVKQISDT